MDPVVQMRRAAGYSCFGAVGGVPVLGSTANVTGGFFTISATVHLHGLPFTFYTIQLVTSGCQTQGSGFVTTNALGNATVTVTAPRGFLADAFVTALGGGDFQISNEASPV